MKPITEDQRQQLISLARIEIRRWKIPDDKQYMVDLMEIALASLTGDPVVTLYSDDRDEYQYTFELETSVPDGIHLLYTAPPVPAIKFPGYYQRDENDTGYNDGWNSCIDAIKLLNGLS